MERTATRLPFTFSVTTAPPLRSARALGGRSSSYSRYAPVIILTYQNNKLLMLIMWHIREHQKLDKVIAKLPL